MYLEEVQCELVLVVDDPDEKEAISLYMMQGQIADERISHRRVGNGNTSGRVSSRKLPRRIHADDVVETAGVLLLYFAEILKVVSIHINQDGNTPELPLVDVADF